MTQSRLKFGRAGEEAAVAYLKKKGYRILQQNYRASAGEVDIVAEHKKVVVFVEVKSRADGEYGDPILAVTPYKQNKIIQTARIFLAKHKIDHREVRFDIVSISGNPGDPESWQLELIQDAFRL
jgi:putative endonuclease